MTNRKKSLIGVGILLSLLLVGGGIYLGITHFGNPNDVDYPDHVLEVLERIEDPDSPTDVKVSFDAEISKVTWVDGKVNAIKVLKGNEEYEYEADTVLIRDYTIIRVRNGERCTAADLKEGQKIRVTAYGTVLYETVIDNDSGKTYDYDSYTICFEIVINEE